MGYWDTIKDVAKIGLDSINAYNVEMQELKQQMRQKSSDELKRIIRDDVFLGSSKKEKTMAYSVLKERGEV